MNFPTLPYDHVTNSFLLEICFWGPTYPTFLYDVTLFSLFFLNSSLSSNLYSKIEMNYGTLISLSSSKRNPRTT